MKATVIGVQRMAGTSSKTQKDFDFTVVRVIVPATPERSAKMTKESLGYEVAELRAKPEVVEQLARSAFPVNCDLSIDNELNRFKQLEAVVTRAVVEQVLELAKKPAVSAARATG